MVDTATADLIADLLQRYYCNPQRYRTQSPREAHGLGHLDVVLRLALGQPVELSDPVRREPAAVAELERAAAFYIRESFFREGASHYDILGLAPDASADAIRENFRLVMQLIHPDRHSVDTLWPDDFATRANRAYAVLKTPKTRADYDRQQAAANAKEAATRAAAMPIRMPAPMRARHRRRLGASVLPEWLTSGVGGFVRGYPGATIFVGLIAVSILMIAAVWPEHESMLVGESTDIAPRRAQRDVQDGARIAPGRSGALPSTADPRSDSTVAAAALPARSPIQSAAAIDVVNSSGAITSGVALSSPPGSREIEALIATFISSYENGHLPMFASLFDDDAQTDLQRGRAAIRSEYEQLFRSTAWRRMRISQLRWQLVGDRTQGKGEFTLKTGWTDGREEEQHVAVDMELMRRGGRTVIAKLSLQPKN